MATPSYKHPVVIISMAILLSVFATIGAAIIGEDHDVLKSMAKSGFARGLITYLFAVVTIGTALVLVVSVLTSEPTEENKERFDRGKEVLSLLLGVFGTIVGFYFGSEVGAKETRGDNPVTVSQPLLSTQHTFGGESVILRAWIGGGVSPYQYGVAPGEDDEVEFSAFVGANGWILEDVTIPDVGVDTVTSVWLRVRDADGEEVVTSARLAVSPASGQ